jgi:hypothetical protein
MLVTVTLWIAVAPLAGAGIRKSRLLTGKCR